MQAYFFKRASYWIQDSRGYVLLKSNILSSKLIVTSSQSQVLNNLLNAMVADFLRYTFLKFEKSFRTSIFLSTSERRLLNIPKASSSTFTFIYLISHFSSLETMYCEDFVYLLALLQTLSHKARHKISLE